MPAFPQRLNEAGSASAPYSLGGAIDGLARRVRFIPVVILLLLACLSGASASSSPPVSNRVPVQAALVKAIEAGRVHAGDAVYARVDLAWDHLDCKLREGAILQGRVVAQTPHVKGTKSELALVFESGQCGGRDMKPLPLTIAAVLAPDPNSNSSLYGNVQSQPLSEAVGLSLGQSGTGSPMRSMMAAAATVILEPPVNKPPVVVMPGQVIGLGSIQLAVGSGPEGSSILSSEKHNLRLETGSRLVLVPSITTRPTPARNPTPEDASNAALSDSSASGDADMSDETDSCASVSCDAAADASLPETNLAAALAMPVASLGFSAGGDREMYDFDHAATISYLGPKRVLLTFNPHVLVARTGSENELPKLHMVRAALIDLDTLHAVRTVDWRIHDAQQYLWPIGDNTVLVHAGSELRQYNSDLKIEHRIALNGPLAFVRVAPSGKYFAAGIIHERHPEGVHRELAEAEGREPEEDVEIRVLDSSFNVLVSVMRSSREVPPVLSDEGEIRIPNIGKNRWRIAEYTWTGQRRVLKQVESGCRPEAEGVPPDLLLVTGCDRLSDAKWFRLLRPDGKTVLRGQFASSERGFGASGIDGSGLFAFGTTEFTKSLADAAAFHSSDLKDLRVSVYQVDNGKRLTAVTVPSPLPTVQSFALAPDGHQLAVLNSNQILFYTLASAKQ